jgi:nucleotide-binding universal stress UspA family protein
MKPLRCIVAGVGELSGDDPTLLLAMDLARRCGAALHLVHAYQLPQLFTMSPGLEIAYPEGSERYAAAVQEALEAAVRRIPGSEGVTCHAVQGAAGATLVAVAEEVRADLVVVGAARPTRLGRPMLGTTAQRVLRGAAVPVLVARTALYRKPQRVLMTTDLSPMSAAVHETALDVLDAMYGLHGMELRSLLVLAFGLVPPPLPHDALRRAARTELDRFLRERRARESQVRPAVRIGEAGVEIVDEVADWNADLLVVGTHARHGLPRMWLGSVAEACIRDSPCSILAIPPVRAAADVSAEREEARAVEAVLV